jgi:hypothetical protein
MPSPPTVEESLNWKREESIDLPMPESEGRLAIRHQDWNRIKTKIQRFDTKGSSLPVIYSVLFGVAGSAGLSIIPISSTKDLSPWVTPFYVLLLIFSLLCGLVFVFVERRLKLSDRTLQTDIFDEMCEIEGMFVRQKGALSPTDAKLNTVKTNPQGPSLEESGGSDE